MLKAIITLIQLLPEIIELIKRLETNAKSAQTEKKVTEVMKDEIQIINKAFEEKDAKALNDLFNK